MFNWLRRKKLTAPQPPYGAAQGNFTLVAQLAGQSGRSIQVQAYIFDGESKESLNGRIDLLQDIIERQRLRCEIPELEARRDQMVKGLQQAREILSDLEAKQRKGETLSSQERMNMRNMRANIEKVNDEIKKGTEAISDARRKSGVG